MGIEELKNKENTPEKAASPMKIALIIGGFIAALVWGFSFGSADPCDCVDTFNYHGSKVSMSRCESAFGLAGGSGPTRAAIACREK